MKKFIFILFMMLSITLLASCKNEGKDIEHKEQVYYTVTEEQWNNNVKGFAFSKNPKSNLRISIYSSPDEENEADFIFYKQGLIYKIVTIAGGQEFISYGDFENKIAYHYYGLDRSNYYKANYKYTIEDSFSALVDDFDEDFSKVKYENKEYISTIPYEGKEKYGHYTFIDGNLRKFEIYFEDELYFKMEIEPFNGNVVLPNANFIDQMSTSEMKTYLTEALKELKSYGAVGADYKVEAYDHYTLATFEYLRSKNSDGSYKTLEELLNGIKSDLVKPFFSNRVNISGQIESLDDYMWFGMMTEGNENCLVIKLQPEDEKLNVVFSVNESALSDILVFKEYLENRLVEDKEEDEFYFDGRVMIDTKDCLLIQYDSEMSGTIDDLSAFAKTCIEDYGYEWVASGSSSDYNYQIFTKENRGVKVNFIDAGENHFDVKITFGITFNGEDPEKIIEFGTDSPLFR